MTIVEFVGLFGLLFFSAIPFGVWGCWAQERAMDIGNKMDKPETVVAMSKGPFYHAIYILINFSKGFFIPYLAESVLMLEIGRAHV